MDFVERVKTRLGADRPSSPRFRVILASLIAMTSLLAALGAWHAEAAAMTGDDAERKGFADGVADQQEQARIRAGIDDALLDYYRAQSYFAQATALEAEAQKTGGPDAAHLRTQATAQKSLGGRLLGNIDRDAIRPNGELDTDRKFHLD